MRESVQRVDERRLTAVPDNVHRLPVSPSDDNLLALEGHALGVAMYDRFGADVNRVVASILGPDPDHDDLVQKVFMTALAKIERLRDRSSLRGWLVAIAANTTRSELRRRQRWRWLSLSPERIEHVEVNEDHDARGILADFYAIVARLSADHRVIFVLRYVEEQPLAEIATICGCSLATVKRRVQRASDRFLVLARSNPELLDRIRQGKTWEAPR